MTQLKINWALLTISGSKNISEIQIKFSNTIPTDIEILSNSLNKMEMKTPGMPMGTPGMSMRMPMRTQGMSMGTPGMGMPMRTPGMGMPMRTPGMPMPMRTPGMPIRTQGMPRGLGVPNRQSRFPIDLSNFHKGIKGIMSPKTTSNKNIQNKLSELFITDDALNFDRNKLLELLKNDDTSSNSEKKSESESESERKNNSETTNDKDHFKNLFKNSLKLLTTKKDNVEYDKVNKIFVDKGDLPDSLREEILNGTLTIEQYLDKGGEGKYFYNIADFIKFLVIRYSDYQIDDVNFMEDEKEGFVFYLNKILENKSSNHTTLIEIKNSLPGLIKFLGHHLYDNELGKISISDPRKDQNRVLETVTDTDTDIDSMTKQKKIYNYSIDPYYNNGI